MVINIRPIPLCKRTATYIVGGSLWGALLLALVGPFASDNFRNAVDRFGFNAFAQTNLALSLGFIITAIWIGGFLYGFLRWAREEAGIASHFWFLIAATVMFSVIGPLAGATLTGFVTGAVMHALSFWSQAL